MMEIKVPLYAATMALYQVLSDAHACGLNWYEGGTDIEEVETDFRNQATFCYGILGAADADQNDKASDIWDYNIQLEVYSNYPEAPSGSVGPLKRTLGRTGLTCQYGAIMAPGSPAALI